ncbi:MAG: ribonuclease [Clostridia bacterium]|jgi:ribonuclease-3|nr:ribonuclease [Clostridiales bacterium]MDK2984744.1 ribonuclease [Clostridia bacterium]
MHNSRKSELQDLVTKCGVELSSLHILNIALTHPTYVFENRNQAQENNQRLEFLGDAVLGMVVAEHLYESYPDLPEGELTKMRAAVVCEPTLAKNAKKIDLGKFLLLGKGEEMTGGRNRASNLADAFEAIIGAFYLDAGFETAKRFILTQLHDDILKASKGIYSDFKTMLQEKIQKLYSDNVNYKIISETGPDHNKTFEAGVFFKGKLLAKGKGSNKKEAEQKAAEIALGNFSED